jgi:parallel beta-helix repeat protein
MSRIMNNICRGRTLRIAIGITILALLLAGGAGAAGAATISSCTEISGPGEYVLDRDIVASSSTTLGCIFINSSNVVFDGAGFTISTDGLNDLLGFVSGVTVEGATAPNGVFTENRLINVTVKNLNLKNWTMGIRYHNATKGTIENINATNNHFDGIILEHSSSNNTISGNIVKFNGFYGIDIDNSNNNMISNNIANSNFNAGIYIEHNSNNNTIRGNTANSNTNPGSGGGEGIYLSESSYNNVRGNIVKFNGDTGIDLSISTNNTVSDNIVNSNGDKDISTGKGITLFVSRNNTISDNNVTSNFGKGIELLSSENNLIYNNFFNNTENAHDTGNNTWNITKILGTNIIGGPYLGGNFWSDYVGKDTDGDGLGDTMIPYNSSGNITHGGDYLPLTQVGVVGSIHGTKFNDANSNKIRDAGEPGLANWTITLTNEIGGVTTTTTDASGNYGFTNLTDGDYTVGEVQQAGWIQTAPATSNYTVTITSGANITGQDFGNKKFSIFGMKFNDRNGNRKRDSGEEGLAGWHIKLVGYDTLTGTGVNREEITDANGNYGFMDVSPGIYQVFEVMQGPNWVPTTPVTVPIVNKKAIEGMNVNFGNKQIP